jgi:hypothetical protein
MKKQAFRVFFGVSLLVLLAVVSAGANSGLNLRATLPFEFTVGDKTLPAGTYTVQSINSYGVLVIRSEDDTQYTLILTRAVEAKTEQEPAKLAFRKYGDVYFLADVWMYGGGQELSKSRKERQVIRELRNHLATRATEPELVYIAAN